MVSQFIQTLEFKKDTWWDMHRLDGSYGQCMGGQRDRECDNQGLRLEGNRNGQYGSFCPNFSSQTPYQSPYQSQYQSPYRQPPFISPNRPIQGSSQTSLPFRPINRNPPSNTYQQRPTGITVVPTQTPPGNQRPPLQPITRNANLYRGPYQNQTGQPYNQQNEGGYRPNYPQPNYLQPSYPQQTRAYHAETTDRFSQFEDYENDYYNNGRFEQEDGWANYAIDEDQAFFEVYKEPQSNEDIDVNHAIVQASYHCRRCPESLSSNNALHKHIRSGHNPSSTNRTQALT